MSADIAEVVARLEYDMEAEAERCLCLRDTNHDCPVDHVFQNDLRALLDAYAEARELLRKAKTEVACSLGVGGWSKLVDDVDAFLNEGRG